MQMAWPASPSPSPFVRFWRPPALWKSHQCSESHPLSTGQSRCGEEPLPVGTHAVRFRFPIETEEPGDRLSGHQSMRQQNQLLSDIDFTIPGTGSRKFLHPIGESETKPARCDFIDAEQIRHPLPVLPLYHTIRGEQPCQRPSFLLYNKHLADIWFEQRFMTGSQFVHNKPVV